MPQSQLDTIHAQGRWDGLTLSEMAEQTAFVDFHMGLQVITPDTSEHPCGVQRI